MFTMVGNYRRYYLAFDTKSSRYIVSMTRIYIQRFECAPSNKSKCKCRICSRRILRHTNVYAEDKLRKFYKRPNKCEEKNRVNFRSVLFIFPILIVSPIESGQSLGKFRFNCVWLIACEGSLAGGFSAQTENFLARWYNYCLSSSHIIHAYKHEYICLLCKFFIPIIFMTDCTLSTPYSSISRVGRQYVQPIMHRTRNKSRYTWYMPVFFLCVCVWPSPA